VVGSGRASTGASPNLPQATIIVNTLEDETIVDGNCSLREAFIASDSNIQVDACTPGQAGITDTITFDVSGTIHLSSQLGLVWNGATVVNGGGVITLDGGGTTSLIGVDTNTFLKIIGMNFINGYAPYYGGAIGNNGTIEIVDSTISGSFAGDTGGGINNSGNLTIEGTTITGNHASGGGGISNNYLATLTVIDSVLSGNSASSGGAIGTGMYSMAVISNCEFTDNHADIQGGGIGNSGTITVTNSTLTGNSGGNQGGGGFSNTGTMTILGTSLSGNQASLGGCLVNGGHATIQDSVFDNNGAPGNPGCIQNYDGSISIQRVTVSNTEGNAILNMGSFNPNTIEVVDSVLIGSSDSAINNNGEMTITQSTIADNSAWSGGGIYNHHEMNISESTISGNSAQTQGGGIFNDGSLSMKNSTVSGNNAQYGAALYLYATGDVDISFSTLAGNSNPTGAAVYNEHGDLIFDNSILYNPDAQGECYSPVAMIDGGHNISSDSTCNFDPANGSMPGTNPLLGPLSDNGGPTMTHALLFLSPAIDSADDAQCPPIDQRLMPRPKDGDGDGVASSDIGAYELQAPITLPYANYLPLISGTP
jgi:CSLREA domain-containing protein